jgi:hypothetical protein
MVPEGQVSRFWVGVMKDGSLALPLYVQVIDGEMTVIFLCFGLQLRWGKR